MNSADEIEEGLRWNSENHPLLVVGDGADDSDNPLRAAVDDNSTTGAGANLVTFDGLIFEGKKARGRFSDETTVEFEKASIVPDAFERVNINVDGLSRFGRIESELGATMTAKRIFQFEEGEIARIVEAKRRTICKRNCGRLFIVWARGETGLDNPVSRDFMRLGHRFDVVVGAEETACWIETESCAVFDLEPRGIEFQFGDFENGFVEIRRGRCIEG